MTGIDFGYWLNKFVAVCDPDPPAPQPGVRGFVQEGLRPAGFLGAEMAVRRAQEGLAVYGLNERKNYADVLQRRGVKSQTSAADANGLGQGRFQNP